MRHLLHGSLPGRHLALFKLGIVKYEGLDHPITFFGKKKRASTLLLKDLFQRSIVDSEKYNTTIRCILTPTGTWKDTRNGRFSKLDQTILAILKNTYSASKRLIVADFAASSGATSVEFYKVLQSAFSIDFIATDLWYEAIAIKAPHFGWVIVVDDNGNDLQYVIGPFVLPGQGHESLCYPINRALRQLCRWVIAPKAHSIFRTYNPLEHMDFETTVIDKYEITKLPLLSYECMETIKSCRNFRFMVSDIMKPFVYRVDVIRAMNILTLDYFDESHLRRGLHNCLNALNSGGILVLGKSPTDRQDDTKATIYLNKDKDFEVIGRINGGCEIEHLLEAHTKFEPSV